MMDSLFFCYPFFVKLYSIPSVLSMNVKKRTWLISQQDTARLREETCYLNYNGVLGMNDGFPCLLLFVLCEILYSHFFLIDECEKHNMVGFPTRYDSLKRRNMLSLL